MKLIKHDSVILKPVKMLCDTPLHNKLENTELTKHFFNKTNFTLVVGVPGSGKTTFTVGFIQQIYKKVFNKVICVMPESSRASLSKNPFHDLPPEQVFEELNGDTVADIYNQVKDYSAEEERTLLVLDDVQHALKNKFVLQSFKKIIANRRHLRTTIICICQNYTALDKSLRLLVNNLICFNLGNVQFEKIKQEHLNMKQETFDKIRKFAFKNPHDWILINPDTERIFKGFDEISYKQEMNSDSDSDSNSYTEGKKKK
jgi:type IV secretory pathway VirB4 component